MRSTKKSPSIQTDSQDNFLYNSLINLLKEFKLVNGGTELAYTLRNHPKIRDYLRSKQITKINFYDDTFFNPDGTLNSLAIQNYVISYKSSLQTN